MKSRNHENSNGGLIIPDDLPPINERRYELKPDESKVYTVDLTELYGKLEPGIYKVNGHSFKKGQRDWIKTNEIFITIA